MKYALNAKEENIKRSMFSDIKRLLPLLKPEKKALSIALVALIISSLTNLAGPLLLGIAIDQYITTKQFEGTLLIAGLMLGVYGIALISMYVQTSVMGGVGQRTLFKLRNDIFLTLQRLPIAFFNQNKAGDLISRINNDTEKLNDFFSRSLIQFMGNIFMMIGAGVMIIVLHIELGLAALLPAVLLIGVIQLVSPWIKRKNAAGLRATGQLSGEVQESLGNFKVILAFHRRDYFRKRFDEANEHNYQASVWAGIANQIFTPIFTLAYNIAQVVVLGYGIYLISTGAFTVGLLISFFTYINRFYEPLRFMAALWASFQVALAGWDRVSDILELESDLTVVPDTTQENTQNVLTFKNVGFAYEDGVHVIRDVDFTLERGKTYALVGPTGGGKTTTASLMARLYDPTEGRILLAGKDIRSYSPEERTRKIGFIVQDPFLFSGTVRDNLLYGNDTLMHMTSEELSQRLTKAHLDKLINKFPEGLETQVSASLDAMSLGQKQLIAFMRAVLREPDLLILDEATANIDTVTEQLLEEILLNLPAKTTKVVIAHRLNTIENADEIFFVNGGSLTRAHSMEEAVNMLLHNKRAS